MLTHNWQDILKRAWSVRLIVLAAILSACEVALPVVPVDIPPKTFAVLSGLVTALALVARIVAQKDVD